jgi:hypothetical protein
MTTPRQRRKSTAGTSKPSSKASPKAARKGKAATPRTRSRKPKDEKARGDDLYEVDCVNMEPVDKPDGKIDAANDQEIVAEKISVGESERIVIYRKSAKKSCTRYVLKDIFD